MIHDVLSVPELRALLQVTHGPYDSARVLMFTAYLDESADSLQQVAYGIAGYFAAADAWTPFWSEWDGVLQAAGLQGFHAVDCEHGHNDFAGLSIRQREQLVRELIRVIVNHDPMGVVTSIDLRAYNAVQPRIKQLRRLRPGLSIQGSLEDPYFLAFQHAIEHVALSPLVTSSPLGDRVGFVFDRHHLSGRANGLYASMVRGVPYTARLGSLTFDDKVVIKPLQAADLLAYEAHRHFYDTLLKGAPERWQFTELRPSIGEARFFGKEQIDELMRHLEAQFGTSIGASGADASASESQT